MGFTTGFIGGATLVLGTTYLTLQAHQRNRLHQAHSLRAQTYVLNSLTYVPASAPPPKTIAEELALLEHQQELLALAHQNRRTAHEEHSFLESAKERWNTEVEAAVRWVANKDWTAAREDAEDAAARVWARATGSETPERTRVRVVERASAAADTARITAAEGLYKTKESAVRTKEIALTKAEDAKDAGASIWERGFRKSKEIAAKAQAAVGMAEEKVKFEVEQVKEKLGESEAEKVIRQRYERKPEDVLNKSVEEVLAERYKPIGQ